MPIRGLITVLLIISGAATGWYFLVHRDGFSLTTDGFKGHNTCNPRAGRAGGAGRSAFVTARVGDDREAVFTGHGAPGSVINMVASGQVVGTANVSPRGDWTIVLDHPLTTGSRELNLRADVGGNPVVSDESAIIHTTTAGTTPLVLDVRFGAPTRFLQRPDDLPASGLALDAVDCDSAGGFLLSGHAAAGSIVRIYLDNQPIGDAPVDGAGLWSFSAASVAPGAYTLRVDQLGLKSIVVARMEAPLERGDAFSVARAFLGDGMLLVQPGENLWRIGRQIPNKGYQYIVLYRASPDKQRDPNQIYPGQVFEPVEAPKPQ